MLVLIVISYINLAYPACGIIPEDLGQHTDLKTPVPWYPVSPRHISYHCKFPCKRIPEAVQKHKKRIWSDNFLKRPYEWCYKQPCHPSMHFIRYPAVETFAKHDVYIRVCNRIAQPREHPPVVCDYITVMQCNNFRLCIGDDISIGYPRRTPLSVFSGPYIIPFQGCIYLLNPFPLVMNNLHFTGKLGHEFPDILEFLIIRPAKGQDNLTEISYLFQFSNNSLNCLPLKLCNQCRKHQRYGPLPCKLHEFRLNPFQTRVSKPVQCNYQIILIEVCHRSPPINIQLLFLYHFFSHHFVLAVLAVQAAQVR